jgi:hypothetical protein
MTPTGITPTEAKKLSLHNLYAPGSRRQDFKETWQGDHDG